MKIKLHELRAIIRETIEEAAPMFGDEFEPENGDEHLNGHLHPDEKEDVDNFNRFNAAYKNSKITPQDSKPFPEEDSFDWDSDGPSPDYPDYSDIDADDRNYEPESGDSQKLASFVKSTNQLAKEDGHSFEEIKQVMQDNKDELQALVMQGNADQATALVMHKLFDIEAAGYAKNGHPKSWKI